MQLSSELTSERSFRRGKTLNKKNFSETSQRKKESLSGNSRKIATGEKEERKKKQQIAKGEKN